MSTIEPTLIGQCTVLGEPGQVARISVYHALDASSERVLKTNGTSLSAARGACQSHFSKPFLRILIKGLSVANRRLAKRAAEQ